jgi:hypothetical protein
MKRRYACMSRPYAAQQVQSKPTSDRTVLMADKYGAVSYVRDDGAGGVERVSQQDVVHAHIKRRKRQREDGKTILTLA